MPGKMPECVLGGLLAGAIWLLAVVQAGIYVGNIEPAGTWLGAEYAGETVEVAAGPDEPYGIVVLELVDFSRLEQAEVLVNGRCAARFDKAQVRVRVAEGDVLALNVQAYGRQVRVRLVGLSSVIDESLLCAEVAGCRETVEIGRVAFR